MNPSDTFKPPPLPTVMSAINETVVNITKSTIAVTTITTNITTTLSPSQIDEILRQKNDEKAALYIPVIVYMIILTIVGTFGNVLVCCVYCTKPTKTSSQFFIIALAVFDILTCLIGMPTEVTDLRYPYMFYASEACKLLRFIESVTTIGSSIILIAVAVDRYLRICKLGRQISVKLAKRLCVAAMLLGVLLSWPSLVIFGRSSEEVHPGVVGIDCSTEDSMKHTVYPSLYYGFLGLLFVCCLTFFTVIYCQIGFQIWKQKKMKIGNNNRNSDTSKSRTFSNSSMKETDPTDNTTGEHNSDPISTDMSSDPATESTPKRKLSHKDRRISSISACSTKGAKKRQIKVTRTTVVLFAVTVAYVLSYLPFLILMVIRSVKKDFEDNLSPSGEVFYKFCVKSYFISNATNPLIYSFLNINFRKDANELLRRVWALCCFCRRSNSKYIDR